MATRKSTPIIVIGVAVFVVGAALAFILLRNGNTKSKTTTAAQIAATPTTLAASSAVTPTASAAAATPPAGFTIPAGKNAVAVQVTQLAGLDGFAKAGDLVNVYATIKNQRINIAGLTQPEVKLVATNIDVLAVLANASTAAPTGTAVYMLALDPVTAEQVIFFSTYESLYFTLVPKGSAPAQTPGRSYQNAV